MIHAPQVDVTDQCAGFRVREPGLEDDRGDCRTEAARKCGQCVEIISEGLAKKARRDQGVVHTAQSPESHVAQAGAHRIAHQQGTRQHRTGDRDAQQHGNVRTPIEGQAANCKWNSPEVFCGLSLNVHSVSDPSAVTIPIGPARRP